MKQARLWADQDSHMRVVRRLYEMRFPESLDPGLTLQQIRGMEGVRVREAYAASARTYGVEWKGREYKRNDWGAASTINRALSAANSCLYGICHAAILSAGYSPALGFVHTGKMLSFVYDVADLYKTEISVPTAFLSVAEGAVPLEASVRTTLRDRFFETRLLSRIVDDLALLFEEPKDDAQSLAMNADAATPGTLWDPSGEVPAGTDYGVGQAPTQDEG